MKHNDTTLQAAIDAAMLEIGKQVSGKNFAACPKYYRSAWPEEADDRLALAKAFLAKLPEPEPILADDGRSLGQVAHEASKKYDEETYGSSEWKEWSDIKCQDVYEAAAQSVANVVLAQAIRRMEAVPVEEVAEIIRRQWLDRGGWIEPAADALRARLIQAAKGQGEQPDSTDLREALKIANESADEQMRYKREAEARAEKAEAELAERNRKLAYAEEHLEILAKTFGYEGRTWGNMVSYLSPRLQKAERNRDKAEAELAALKSSNIGILRPLSKAGPVPDGCVRVTALKNYEDEWAIGDSPSQRDTHFADIRLPSNKTPAQTANEQPKQQVPLGPEDVMPGSVLRHIDQRNPWSAILWVGQNEMGTEVQGYSWDEASSFLQINRSIPLTGKWDANAWEPCYKLI